MCQYETMNSVIAAPMSAQTVDQRVGELIRFWMYRRDINQPQLGKLLGLTRATVSRKISGKVTWTVTELAKTAAILEVPLSELMPEDTVEIAKSLEANASRDRGTVAGAGFEPTTSGLISVFGRNLFLKYIELRFIVALCFRDQQRCWSLSMHEHTKTLASPTWLAKTAK